jgi:hypothetical protein
MHNLKNYNAIKIGNKIIWSCYQNSSIWTKDLWKTTNCIMYASSSSFEVIIYDE